MPLYVLGLMGATRRLDHFSEKLGWTPLFVVAALGAALILAGIGFHFLQVVFSIKHRKRNADVTGDPWNGRTLEWSIPSPPPFYNFAHIPHVQARDAFWEMKKSKGHRKEAFEDIHMPKNTPWGFYIGTMSFLFGFAMVWYIFWLAILSFVATVICVIIRLSDDNTDYYVPAAEVAKIEAKIAKQHELG
jgi:cytochrome o ubiquinol oxidase subunit 1